MLSGCISVHVYYKEKLSRQGNESEIGDASVTSSHAHQLHSNNMKDYLSTYNEFCILRGGKSQNKMSSSRIRSFSRNDLNKKDSSLDHFFYETLLSNSELSNQYFSYEVETRYFEQEMHSDLDRHIKSSKLKVTKQYNLISPKCLHYYINSYGHAGLENIGVGLHSKQFSLKKNGNRSMLNILCSPAKRQGSFKIGNSDSALSYNCLDLVIHSIFSKVVSEHQKFIRNSKLKALREESSRYPINLPLRLTSEVIGFQYATKIDILGTLLSYLNGGEDESSFMLSEEHSFADPGHCKRKGSVELNFNEMSLLFSNISFEHIYNNQLKNMNYSPILREANDSIMNSTNKMPYFMNPKKNTPRDRELLNILNAQLSDIGVCNQLPKDSSPLKLNDQRSLNSTILGNWEKAKLHQAKSNENQRAFSHGQAQLSFDIKDLLSDINSKVVNTKKWNPESVFSANAKRTKSDSPDERFCFLNEMSENPFVINLSPNVILSISSRNSRQELASNSGLEAEKEEEGDAANTNFINNYRVSEETESDISKSSNGRIEQQQQDIQNFANPLIDNLN